MCLIDRYEWSVCVFLNGKETENKDNVDDIRQRCESSNFGSLTFDVCACSKGKNVEK